MGTQIYMKQSILRYEGQTGEPCVTVVNSMGSGVTLLRFASQHHHHEWKV